MEDIEVLAATSLCLLDNGKDALRYGFHRTKECNNFELAFVCIQKCLDLGFDVAHADKECLCTCFTNKVKAKYKNKNVYKTKWRYGAPTTKHPAWILPLLPSVELPQPSDGENSDEGKEFENRDGMDNNGNTAKNDTVSNDNSGKGTGSNNGTPDDNATPDDKGIADNNGTLGGAADGDAANVDSNVTTLEGGGAVPKDDAAPAENNDAKDDARNE